MTDNEQHGSKTASVNQTVAASYNNAKKVQQSQQVTSQPTCTATTAQSQTQAQSQAQPQMQPQMQAQGQSQTTTSGRQTQQKATHVIGVFSDRSQAEQAVRELRQQGFTTEEINLVTKEEKTQTGGEYYDDDITDGAVTGGTLGGIGGLLLGAGAMAVPGIGPVLAAGPLAAAISGVVAGGIAGGLIDWGIPTEASHRYEETVAQGNTLAVIRASSSKAANAENILRSHGANEVKQHKIQ